ncbi:hypothetical protein OH77DRAFT_978241 [Trametes cingulata]|nr:hypothetical protein OH77DRAFT_978241 [Trametes cingulata]
MNRMLTSSEAYERACRLSYLACKRSNWVYAGLGLVLVSCWHWPSDSYLFAHRLRVMGDTSKGISEHSARSTVVHLSRAREDAFYIFSPPATTTYSQVSQLVKAFVLLCRLTSVRRPTGVEQVSKSDGLVLHHNVFAASPPFPCVQTGGHAKAFQNTYIENSDSAYPLLNECGGVIIVHPFPFPDQ